MIHYFSIADFKMAADWDFVAELAEEWKVTEKEMLEFHRKQAEDYVKGRLEVNQDITTTAWDVDANLDGVSDNVPGIVAQISLYIALYFLACRRTDVPQIIKDNYNIADMKLERIVDGTMAISPEMETTNRISGNMTEEDIDWGLDSGIL